MSLSWLKMGRRFSSHLSILWKCYFPTHWGFATIVRSCPIQFPRAGPLGFFNHKFHTHSMPQVYGKLLQCKAQLLLVLVPRVQTGAAAELAGHALWNPLCPELHCTLQLVPASEQQEKHVLSSITSTLNTSTVNLGEASVFLHKLSLAADLCTSLINPGCTPSSLRCPVLGKAMALAAGNTQKRSLKINREQAAWFS